MQQLRVGHGYDVQAFDVRGTLVLGGVQIDHPVGLKAHSDGDVVLHAVADALLGACGLGDIGMYFPDADARFKGMDSSVIVQQVLSRVIEIGFAVVNIDVTLIAQTPKLSAYREQIVARLAQLLGVEQNAVNVKATTTEGLGYIGRKEGIAVHAVVLIGACLSERSLG